MLALGCCLLMRGQMLSDLTYRRYTVQDGLPQMQTERLWQDSRGYIYVGTLSGFVRFDGRAFTPFLKGRRLNIVGFAEVDDNGAPLHGHGEVRALGFFRQWTVDYDGVEPLPLDEDGHWLLNNLNAGSLPNGYVLMEDSLEQQRRLCLMTRQTITPVLAHPLLDTMTPDRKLYYDPESGEAIAPTEQGTFLLKPDGGQPTKLWDKTDVYTLLRTDSALLAFASDGIYAWQGDSLRLLTQADWSAASYGLTVRKIRTDCVVADEHSVYLCDGEGVHQVVTGINLIRDVLVDRWDRLWVATYQGVYCFFTRCFTNHQLADENDIVRAVAACGDGRLLMGTLNGKLMVRSQRGATTIVDDNPEQFYAPSAAKVGDEVFMAGNGDVVAITTHSDTTATLRWIGLPRDRYQFVASAWGRVIVGSRTTISAYDPATATIETLVTTIIHPWCAAQDASGKLWIGSSGGLYCIDKNRQMSKVEYGQQKLVVSALATDQRGNIFFASADSLFCVVDGHVESLTPQMPQLSGHEVRSLHLSPRGFLVAAVVDGLFVCRVDDKGRLSDQRFFNHLNGFTMTEPLKAVMAEEDDGTVWLPGIEQMTSFRPEELLAYSEEDTYIAPPLAWWQHWWVWALVLLAVSLMVWAATRWHEKRVNRKRMVKLQRENIQREEQIEAIRQKVIGEADSELAKDIVKMTEKTFAERLTLRTASGTVVVEVKDIAYFKGEGNYSQLVTFHHNDMVLMGLGALEKMLSPEVFVRADRSTLLNIHHVSNLLPKQRRCIFRSPGGQEVETTLLAPAFKRLEYLL